MKLPSTPAPAPTLEAAIVATVAPDWGIAAAFMLALIPLSAKVFANWTIADNNSLVLVCSLISLSNLAPKPGSATDTEAAWEAPTAPPAGAQLVFLGSLDYTAIACYLLMFWVFTK